MEKENVENKENVKKDDKKKMSKEERTAARSQQAKVGTLLQTNGPIN